MDANEINRLLVNEKNFIGVFALDKLPKKKVNRPVSMIINNEVSGEKGEHWVSLVMLKKQAYYFDSFGLQIIDKQILSFLAKQKITKVIFSTKCIQSITSDKCGLFCILFVKTVKNKNQYKKFLNLFSENQLSINDHLVVEYLKI